MIGYGLLSVRLKIQSQQRFGIACSHIAPPITMINRYTIEPQYFGIWECFNKTLHRGGLIFNFKVDFTRLTVAASTGDDFAEWASVFQDC